jgi:sarcosine oxidase
VKNYDVIVLGLGAMGSSALHQLASKNVSVLGIDQYDPPHRLGSTHGESRITRLACGEGTMYSALAKRSHRIWTELEEELDVELLKLNGLAVIGGPRGAHRHHNLRFVETTEEAAELAGVSYERLLPAELMARHPAFRVSDDEKVYYDKDSGYVMPEACIRAQLVRARQQKADIKVNERVISFEDSSGGVRVTTDRGVYHAGQLIITAGPWLPQLLRSSAATTKVKFTVRRQVLYWFALADRKALQMYKPENFPVYIWMVPDREQNIYGFPALGGVSDGMKVATEQEITENTPEDVSRFVSEEERREMYDTYVEPFFNGVTSQCVRAEVCLYTLVKDARFIIDRHPDKQNVLVASPCSGHGFKHSGGIGEVLTQLALREAVPNDIDMEYFSWQGPAKEKAA